MKGLRIEKLEVELWDRGIGRNGGGGGEGLWRRNDITALERFTKRIYAWDELRAFMIIYVAWFTCQRGGAVHVCLCLCTYILFQARVSALTFYSKLV